ncbi:MAG: glycosyltransferase family 2 protein [Lachnospiraceae bacterium]|nr:glycosyltransferase family 2 protein [Lachnospiraceae bacterium]
MDKLISIIIPCYNVEKYIDRCFDSLLNQTIGFDKLEILFVDDCSIDGTWDKLTAIEAAYPESVMIIHCDENGRQGSARNIGLQYASAPYIGFVDSDDWIESDMYEKLYAKMTAYQCDIVMCQNWRDTAKPDQTLAPKLTGDPDRLLKIDTVEKRKIFIACGSIDYGPCNKLFSKDFLMQNDIFFPEKLAYEDHFFATLFYFYATRVYILEERLYHYYVNPASTVLSPNATHHFDILTVHKMLWAECENRGFLTEYRKEVEYQFLTLCYLTAMKMISLRLQKAPYNFFLELKEETLKRIPDYHANPYIKDYVTEMNQILLQLLDLPISEQDLNAVCDTIRSM